MFEPVTIAFPPWLARTVPTTIAHDDPWDPSAGAHLAVDLARRNVDHRTGGPFGAVIVHDATGRVLGAGVNLVEPARDCVLHAEVVAIIVAQRSVGDFTLRSHGPCTLYSSCESCAMCLGATLWSGVARLVCSGVRDDAERIGFDEGPVDPASYAYLASRGITVLTGVARADAREVFARYVARGGAVYNG